MDALHQLFEHGQSYWLDNLTRQMIASGELKRRVHDEGLRGVTSNPAIFHKAISQGEGIERLLARRARGEAFLPARLESPVQAGDKSERLVRQDLLESRRHFAGNGDTFGERAGHMHGLILCSRMRHRNMKNQEDKSSFPD
jgi:hypothetical protein